LDIILTQYLLYVFVQNQVAILFLLVAGLNGLPLIKRVFMDMKLEHGAAMNIVHPMLLLLLQTMKSAVTGHLLLL
jgi:hypothetical protein